MPNHTTLRTPLLRAAVLIALIFAAGTVGYHRLGAPHTSWLDALYMTVITLTTVGFGEIVDLQHHPEGRLFTIVLLFAGVGTFVYFISNLTAFFVEGRWNELLWSRRMNKRIAALSGHTIVCGGGHTGEAVLGELVETERPLVLIERDPERVAELERVLGREIPVVFGDATDDDALRAAGVERAAGLCATVSNDKDNLIVTVSARLLNPNLRIVARCVDKRTIEKLRKSGADAVVSPNLIGGLRLVSELVRPTAVSFLDIMLRDRDQRLRVEEVPVLAGSPLVGRALDSLEPVRAREVMVVALRRDDGHWVYNPLPEHVLQVGEAIVFMGAPEARRAVERAAGIGVSAS